MKIRIVILLIFNFIVYEGIFSQLIFNQNLYIENKYLINPAYAGYTGNFNSYLSYKNTSSSIKGSPTFFNFGASSPIFKKMSLGGRLYRQTEGLFNTLTGFADYSYFAKLSNYQTLRFGVSSGFISNQLDRSKIIAEDPSAIIDVASRSFEGFGFQSAAGIAYNFKNLEIGFSSPQLFESKGIIKPSFLTTVMYNFKLTNNEIVLTPSFLVKYKANNPTIYDINVMTNWKDTYWLGIGYRNRPCFIVSAGISFKTLKLGYAIEMSADKYSNLFNQIHEISISYTLRRKQKTVIDTSYNLNNQIIANNTTKDSTIATTKDSTGSSISAKSDSLTNKNAHNYNIVEAGAGIYVIKAKGDSTQTDMAKNYENEVDSIMINELINKIDSNKQINTIKVVEDGKGIFTIKATDNTMNNKDLDDKMIDSIMKSNELIQKISTNDTETESYYTIQLLITDPNNEILRNANIVSEINIQKSIEGELVYLYGKYKSESEAKKSEEELKAYNNLKTQIIFIK